MVFLRQTQTHAARMYVWKRHANKKKYWNNWNKTKPQFTLISISVNMPELAEEPDDPFAAAKQNQFIKYKSARLGLHFFK